MRRLFCCACVFYGVLGGFTAQGSSEIIGDGIAGTVTWSDCAEVSHLAGRPVRLKFILKDADLYSFQFQP